MVVGTVVGPLIVVIVSVWIVIINITNKPYTTRQNEKKENHYSC